MDLNNTKTGFVFPSLVWRDAASGKLYVTNSCANNSWFAKFFLVLSFRS